MLFSARRVGLTVAACLFAFALLVSCANTGGTGAAARGLIVGLPSLSSLDSRGASGVVDLTATGIETLARSAGAVELGSNLYLGATQGSAEWAVYRLQPPTGMVPSSAVVNLTDASTDEAWVAVADYASLRWEFSGPYGAAADLSDLGASHVSPGGYAYLAVVVSGGHAAVVESVFLTCEGNLPPVASFTATPQTGSPGAPVTLDASASSDPDGSIVNYAWDLDGDGSFETDGGSDPMANTTLPNPAGTVDVGLKVTDDGGAVSINTISLDSNDAGSGTWQTFTVTSENCDSPSLALINGKPAIAYYVAGNSKDLMFAYSNVADGSSGWNTIVVDEVGNVGVNPSLSSINSKPAISYCDFTNGDLKYAYSSTTNGSDGWTTLVVQDEGLTGLGSSLATINGKPAISFNHGWDEELRYAYSSTADGSSGWSVITVDTYGSIGRPSLALINGKPATGYCRTNPAEMVYAYSSSLDGSSDWTVVTIETGNSFSASSLSLIDGKPAIAYYNYAGSDDGRQKYAYSSQLDGSGGWSTLTVDADDYGGDCSLCLVGGKPAISFSVNGLKYAYSSSIDGSSDWTTNDIDSAGGSPSMTTLANARPAIAYSANGLKYAVLVP